MSIIQINRVSQHPELRTGFVGAKLYCPHDLADGN